MNFLTRFRITGAGAVERTPDSCYNTDCKAMEAWLEAIEDRRNDTWHCLQKRPDIPLRMFSHGMKMNGLKL